MPKELVNAVCVFTGKVSGVIYLEESKNKKQVKIYGDVKGLKPGKHGFHVHEAGDLSEGCSSCCAHYNPYDKKHGGPKDTKRHVGDLGNITALKNGEARVDIVDSLIKLRGKYSVIGRSLVVHEDEDDLGLGDHDDSKTTGHAGARVACGVIGFRKNCK
jgi:superoxide dismutase, Cu-Zn family